MPVKQEQFKANESYLSYQKWRADLKYYIIKQKYRHPYLISFIGIYMCPWPSLQGLI